MVTQTIEVFPATWDAIQHRLITLVEGYWDVAQRLIELARRKNPGMPENGY
ncbi:hypothetical protein H6F96_09565 [Microcoleus sp. FACHB-53]|nr:hypothetical protein [Microcoleus sp. FACHB-53]MBD2125851.1 hypothetical protein [Microcoleus sp. FACHB-1]